MLNQVVLVGELASLHVAAPTKSGEDRDPKILTLKVMNREDKGYSYIPVFIESQEIQENVNNSISNGSIKLGMKIGIQGTLESYHYSCKIIVTKLTYLSPQ